MLAVVISVSAVGVERRVWVGCWVANLGLWALGFIRKFQISVRRGSLKLINLI